MQSQDKNVAKSKRSVFTKRNARQNRCLHSTAQGYFFKILDFFLDFMLILHILPAWLSGIQTQRSFLKGEIVPKYEYSKMEIESPESFDPTNDVVLDELNRLGAEGWLVVSSLACCENGNGTDTCSALIAREIPE